MKRPVVEPMVMPLVAVSREAFVLSRICLMVKVFDPVPRVALMPEAKVVSIRKVVA